MANTPKVTRKGMKKGATQMRAIRNTDAGLPRTTAQKNSVKKAFSPKRASRIVNGNIPAGRTPKEAAADSAQNKGITKEALNPSMKLKAARAKKAKAVMAKKKN